MAIAAERIDVDGIPVMQYSEEEWGLPHDVETPAGLDFHIGYDEEAEQPYSVDLFRVADRNAGTAYVDTFEADTLEEAVRNAWNWQVEGGER
jgi:hypothetical protein